MTDKKTFEVLGDIGMVFTGFFVPIFVLLKVIEGINYFESQSTEWWMVIALVILIIKSDFMGLHHLDRLKKYLKPVVNYFILLKKNIKDRRFV